MAKERITVYLEPELIKRLKSVFPGANVSQASAKAIELYFDTKDYADWAIRTAVISRATMEMVAQSSFPGEVDRQEQFMFASVAKADSWVRRRLREEVNRDSASPSV